jgi:hypothetical protein
MSVDRLIIPSIGLSSDLDIAEEEQKFARLWENKLG